MGEDNRFQFTLRGLLGYFTLVAVALLLLRLGYVTLHGYVGLFCIAVGFILSGATVGIPIGLALGGKSGARVAVVFMAILSVLFVLISFVSFSFADGYFSLTVNLLSSASLPITKIEYLETASLEERNATVRNPRYADGSFRSVTDFDGKKFTARIPFSYKCLDLIRYEIDYSEYSFLVVHVQYQNGEHKYIAAEIPAGRGARSITLTVP